MRDRTNREKPDLRKTIEGIGMMYEGLQSLLAEEYPRGALGFAIMAQGPVDQIRDLLDDVEWHIEDMIPQHLRAQAAQLEREEADEPIVLPEAA